MSVITSMLLDGLDEAFDKKSWHGPNLRGAIRGVTAAEAAWRPAGDRHNIWELTLPRQISRGTDPAPVSHAPLS